MKSIGLILFKGVVVVLVASFCLRVVVPHIRESVLLTASKTSCAFAPSFLCTGD